MVISAEKSALVQIHQATHTCTTNLQLLKVQGAFRLQPHAQKHLQHHQVVTPLMQPGFRYHRLQDKFKKKCNINERGNKRYFKSNLCKRLFYIDTICESFA